jgi:signal transduction histidine kinase
LTGKAPPRIVAPVLGNARVSKSAYRDQVLVNETRTELKGSIAAWVALSTGTAFLAFTFAGRADPVGFFLWLGAIGTFLVGWLFAWIGFIARPPSDEAILTRWIPGAKAGMILCNVATAGSVWVFLPVSEPELRALMLVLLAWFLIIQFAAATEATQVLRPAVLLVLGSLVAWLLVARPPHFLVLAIFLPLFGATLVLIRRFVRQAVVEATTARAAAEAARRDLERERDAKTHFIRAASHDLQQPLQAASLFLDRVKTGGRATDQTASLGGVKRSLTVARTLVGAMLDHLKLESGAVQPDMATFTAGDLFERVLLTQAPAANAAGLRITTAGRGVPLHADPLLLARAVENLVANAVRHSGGRRIVMGARRHGGAATIWVVDDGRGLSEGDEARIFAPFEQGAHVGAAGGFGLGLASTRGLVELMGGACGVRRGLTRGAAFYVRLGTAAPEEIPCAA